MPPACYRPFNYRSSNRSGLDSMEGPSFFFSSSELTPPGNLYLEPGKETFAQMTTFTGRGFPVVQTTSAPRQLRFQETWMRLKKLIKRRIPSFCREISTQKR